VPEPTFQLSATGVNRVRTEWFQWVPKHLEQLADRLAAVDVDKVVLALEDYIEHVDCAYRQAATDAIEALRSIQ
jgi:hypothetical protein